MRRTIESLGFSRRAFVKGAGGVVVSLPVLDLMLNSHGTALAAGAFPNRFMVAFAGMSLGGSGTAGGSPSQYFVPGSVGANYDLTGRVALEPLTQYGNVKDQITVVTGLKVPWATGTAPAGGWTGAFHWNAISPLVTGMRSTNVARESLSSYQHYGASADQVVAGNKSPLAFRVQPANYRSANEGGSNRGRLSYRKDASGNTVAVDPTVSPNLAFNSLFGNFQNATSTPGDSAKREADLRRRKSVLDLVKSQTQALVPRLGAADRRRIERHFEEIRNLELRVNEVPIVAGGSCQKPADPGADPLVGRPSAGGGGGPPITESWSDEEKRARVFCDIVHMAFACNINRVATLMFTYFQCFMNAHPITGIQLDVHEISHKARTMGGGTLEVSRAIAWHMKHFAYLVARLRDTPEGAGNLLDSSAIVFLFEGGHGRTPESASDFQPHSTERMGALIAGKVGGLKPGRHVVATDMHPVQVLITAMNAVGTNASKLGEVTGNIPALIT